MLPHLPVFCNSIPHSETRNLRRDRPTPGRKARQRPARPATWRPLLQRFRGLAPCQPAPSRTIPAQAPAATVRAIPARWAFMAAVSACGITTAALAARPGQATPKVSAQVRRLPRCQRPRVPAGPSRSGPRLAGRGRKCTGQTPGPVAWRARAAAAQGPDTGQGALPADSPSDRPWIARCASAEGPRGPTWVHPDPPHIPVADPKATVFRSMAPSCTAVGRTRNSSLRGSLEIQPDRARP